MKTSKQLNDLIKNASKQLNINAQVLQKRYFMERLLERISKSDYQSKFILKGGILISALVGLRARSTMDIDITVKHTSLNPDSITDMVTAIIQTETDDSVQFVFRKVESIREEVEYDCYRVSLDVMFDKIRDNIKIDITTGDAITPREIQFGYETMLDKKIIPLYAYPIETIMAEKIETVLSRGVLNTRMRDFYDCYLLDKFYGNTIHTEIFYEALFATAQKRTTENILTKTAVIIAEIKSSIELKKLWESYQRTFPYANEVTFEETLTVIEKYTTVFLGKNKDNIIAQGKRR